MAFYNVGLGSVCGGIGSLINKKSNEKWSKVFIKGLCQGAFGGYLVYESKNLIGKISENQRYEYSWYAKAVNSAGISIIENASSNRDLWEQWNLNIGFNRIEFYTKNKFKAKYKIMPVSLLLTIGVASNSKFEFDKTIQTGEFIFSKKLNKDNVRGITYGTAIILDSSETNNYSTISHEIIHIYQYYDFNFINSYFDKPKEQWKIKSNTFKKLNNIFYFDIQGGPLNGIYLLENINRNNYYDNFFENEAGFYSNTISRE